MFTPSNPLLPTTSHPVSYERIKAGLLSVELEGLALVSALDYEQRVEVIQTEGEKQNCNTGSG